MPVDDEEGSDGADGTVEVRGWIDIGLKTFGLFGTAAVILFAALKYGSQRKADRQAAADRQQERRQRALLEAPRCTPDVHAHLLRSILPYQPLLLDIEVELTSHSEARIDFVYGSDESKPETKAEVYAISIGGKVESPLAVVALDLGDVIDPEERANTSAVVEIQPDTTVRAYRIEIEITVIQSRRLAIRRKVEEKDRTDLEKEVAEAPAFIFTDQVVIPSPWTEVVKSATEGPRR